MEEIKMIKAKVLDFMEQEIGKYGNGRMDVKQVGELADVVKDLAEAEYYCSIAQSMEGQQQDSYGYARPMMGYQGQQGSGSTGSMGGGRSGYGMGHFDPMSAIRDILATAGPEVRTQLRNEFMGM